MSKSFLSAGWPFILSDLFFFPFYVFILLKISYSTFSKNWKFTEAWWKSQRNCFFCFWGEKDTSNAFKWTAWELAACCLILSASLSIQKIHSQCRRMSVFALMCHILCSAHSHCIIVSIESGAFDCIEHSNIQKCLIKKFRKDFHVLHSTNRIGLVIISYFRKLGLFFGIW